MQKTDGIAIAEGAACLLDIIERNRSEALGLADRVTGRYLAAHNALYAILHRESDKIKEKDTLIRELSKTAKGKVQQGELYDQNKNVPAGEVPGQQTFDDEKADEKASEPEKSSEPEKAWSVSKATPEAAKSKLIEAVRDGNGKTKAIELVKSELELTKFEAEAYWDELVAAGHLVKNGRNWGAQNWPIGEEKSEEASEASEPEAYQVPVPLREEDLVWYEKTASHLESKPILLARCLAPELATVEELDIINSLAIVADGIPFWVLPVGSNFESEFFEVVEAEMPDEIKRYPIDVSRWVKVHNYTWWLRANGENELARQYEEDVREAEDSLDGEPEQ